MRSAAKWHALSSILCKKLTPLSRLNVVFYLVSAPLTKLKLNDAELPIGELKTATSVDLSNKEYVAEDDDDEDLSNYLQPTDAIIIASLMSMVNAPLTDLNLSSNRIGTEGAKAIAAVLPRCVPLQNGMRSAPSDARN